MGIVPEPAIGNSEHILFRPDYPYPSDTFQDGYQDLRVHSLGCGRNQHERHSGQQFLLLRHRDDSLAGRLIDIADFRRFPGGDDPAESILLFRLFRRDDSSPHGRGARHPCASI